MKNTNDLIRQLGDVRLLGLLAFTIIMLLITWNGFKTIQTNYKLQRQIAEMEQSNKVAELANENMRLRNEYYKTDQYAELVARRQLGLAAPGETVLLVPRSVALSHAPALDKAEQPAEPTEEETDTRSAARRNLDAWMDFFFNRSAID